MNKVIDIDNEEQILKECDFDYYYNSENCSREFCKFFNDINIIRIKNFNKKDALIDLGRIAITLNNFYKELSNTYKEIKHLKFDLAMYRSANELINSFGIEKARDIMFQTELTKKQGQIDYAVKCLEKVKGKLSKEINTVESLLDPTEYEDYHQLIGVIRGYRVSIYEIDKVITEIKKVC